MTSEPLHAMPTPSPSPWSEPISTSGTFRKVLVPSLFLFDRAGTAEGLIPDPSLDPAQEFAAWVKATLDILTRWEPGDIPEPQSNNCSHHWLAGGALRIPFFCTLPPDHPADHEAHNHCGDVVETKKRPTPRTRKAQVA
jgi:hypothetical protein